MVARIAWRRFAFDGDPAQDHVSRSVRRLSSHNFAGPFRDPGEVVDTRLLLRLARHSEVLQVSFALGPTGGTEPEAQLG